MKKSCWYKRAPKNTRLEGFIVLVVERRPLCYVSDEFIVPDDEGANFSIQKLGLRFVRDKGPKASALGLE